ncbi:MAG: hypothetical protein ABFS28_10710, partial [Bacteroidota bacterium]
EYEITSFIDYPEFSPYGENILFAEKISVVGNQDYSLAADLPKGAHLKVRLSGGLWYYRVLPDGPVNWSVSKYDSGNKTQLFTSKTPGEFCDLSIQFSPPYPETDSSTMQDSLFNKEILIECFENLSDTVSWSKRIEILSN